MLVGLVTGVTQRSKGATYTITLYDRAPRRDSPDRALFERTVMVPHEADLAVTLAETIRAMKQDVGAHD